MFFVDEKHSRSIYEGGEKMPSYEISCDTLAIIPVDNFCSKVIEKITPSLFIEHRCKLLKIVVRSLVLLILEELRERKK